VTFGSAFHMLMEEGYAAAKELGLADHLLVEKSFKIELNTPDGKAVLSGRFDMADTEDKVLWDFKTEKTYSVKLMKAGKWEDSKHPWQLNTYRHFAYPEAEHLKLCVLVKDHGRQSRIKDGVYPVEILEVPRIDDAVLHETVIAKIAEHLRCEKEPDKFLRDCTDDETWRHPKTKEPIRCMEYCPAGSEKCIQWLAEKEVRERKKA
jgi:hypothetical protein